MCGVASRHAQMVRVSNYSGYGIVLNRLNDTLGARAAFLKAGQKQRRVRAHTGTYVPSAVIGSQPILKVQRNAFTQQQVNKCGGAHCVPLWGALGSHESRYLHASLVDNYMSSILA